MNGVKGNMNSSTDVDTWTGIQQSSFILNHSINKSLRYNQNHRYLYKNGDSFVQYGNVISTDISDWVVRGKKLSDDSNLRIKMVKEQEDEKYTTQDFMLKAKMEKQKKEEEENDRKKNLQN